VPTLSYEPPVAARPVYVERDFGETRVVVRMPGPYVPVPRWAIDADLLAIVLVPVCWVISLIVRTCLRRPTPPRAVFTFTAETVGLRMTDSQAGTVETHTWPRAAVATLRANRFEHGLWVDVAGHVKDTWMKDLPRETIERLDEALRDVMRSPASNPWSDHSPP
jgi:hypothetical protein